MVVKKDKIIVPSTPLVPERVSDVKKPSLCNECLTAQRDYQEKSKVINSKKLLKKNAELLHKNGNLDDATYNKINKLS